MPFSAAVGFHTNFATNPIHRKTNNVNVREAVKKVIIFKIKTLDA